VTLPFDDEDLESRLVLIWGSPRSGSTWLLEMLCHPFRMDPDVDLGFRPPPEWDGDVLTLPVNEFQIAAHLAPGIYGDSTRGGTIEDEDGAILPRTLNRVTEYFSSYAFSTAYADVWRPEARRLTLVRLYAVIERARAAGFRIPEELPLLVIKEVNGSHGADLVMPLSPRSRMLSGAGWPGRRRLARRRQQPQRLADEAEVGQGRVRHGGGAARVHRGELTALDRTDERMQPRL